MFTQLLLNVNYTFLKKWYSNDKKKTSLSILPTYFFFRAVCREETKEGVCPKLSRDNFRSEMSCSDECSSDSDCSGDNKCCYNGCSYSCLKAVKDPGGLDEETKDDQVPIGNAMLMGGP